MRGFVRSLVTAFVLFTAGAASSALADPPARVGRLSLIEGDVTFQDTATRESAPATLNWPVTGGLAISAAPGARAEVRIGSTAVRLDGATALEFTQLDDQAIRLRLDYGATAVRIRSREVAGEVVLETRDARVGLSEAGRYRVEAGRAPDTTAITVFEGAARVDANGMAFAVPAGRRAEVGGGRARVVDASADEFDDWTLTRDRHDDAAQSSRYVSPETTGYESLDAYGDWRPTPEYGPVWYPRTVPAGWAPYRAGRWAWVEPWGWTWIDEAPWGFAPFHYGRWALVGGAWGWVPGAIVARPVYAPALVGWIGRPGWSVSVTIGSVPAVGWFPLAPRELFVPAYRTSPAYVRNVNIAHVTNATNVVTVTNLTQTRYAYRQVERAVTVVPAAVVTGGAPVERSAVRVRHADLVGDAGGTHAPPADAARPPRQFGSPQRSDDGRWLRSPLPAAAAAADPSRPRGEAERRPEPRADRERRAPTQPGPAVSSRPPLAAVAASAPPAAVAAPAQSRVAAPAQPRVVTSQAPRERDDRHDERRPAVPAPATRARAPMPAPAAVVRVPPAMPAPPAVARTPAPMPAPVALVRTPASMPAPAAVPPIARPQAAPTEGRAPRPEGSRGQQREAREGERRGG